MYKISKFGTLVRIADGAQIPADAANTDYAAYLKWAEAGNTAVPELPTLAEAKAEKLAEINSKAEAVASAMTTGYPEFEMKTWHQQEAEVMAWANGNNRAVATPMIDVMASTRGIDRHLFLEKTLAKVTQYKQASAYLVGLRQKYEDQLNAAASVEAVQAIEPVYSLG